MGIVTKLTCCSGLAISLLSAWIASVLMVSANNIGYFRNISGRLPLCEFLLPALKPVIWTLCFVPHRDVFFSLLLNSLAALQTSCFVCLVYFCLFLIPQLPESGSVTWAWHCHCKSLDLVCESMLPSTKKQPKPPNPCISFIRSDLTLSWHNDKYFGEWSGAF